MFAVAVLVMTSLVACSADEPTIVRRGLPLVPSPASLTLAPGAGGSVELMVTPSAAAVSARFTWSMGNLEVARVDSVDAASTRAYVHATGVGSTALSYTGGGVTGVVPVQVR
jgi:hypothetical protein